MGGQVDPKAWTWEMAEYVQVPANSKVFLHHNGQGAGGKKHRAP